MQTRGVHAQSSWIKRQGTERRGEEKLHGKMSEGASLILLLADCLSSGLAPAEFDSNAVGPTRAAACPQPVEADISGWKARSEVDPKRKSSTTSEGGNLAALTGVDEARGIRLPPAGRSRRRLAAAATERGHGA
jgi:hypothetical protein